MPDNAMKCMSICADTKKYCSLHAYAYIETGGSCAGSCKSSGQDAQQRLMQEVVRQCCCAKEEVSCLQTQTHSTHYQTWLPTAVQAVDKSIY